MKIKIEEGKKYVFLGGLSPKLSHDQIVAHMSKFGQFEQIIVKMRSKPPILNLGYGVLVTTDLTLFNKLLDLRFISLPDSKVEMKEYKEPKIASNLHLMDSLKFHVTLDGLVPGITEADIKAAIFHSCGKLDLRNIVIKKTYQEGTTTGEARVELNRESHVKLVRRSLPLKITLESPGYRTTVLLREKAKVLSKKKMREIKYLESQGKIDTKGLKIDRVRANPRTTKFVSKIETKKITGPRINDPELGSSISSQNAEFSSSFRALLKDLALKNALKNQSKAQKIGFGLLDLNLRKYLTHEKNTHNLIFNKEFSSSSFYKAGPLDPNPKLSRSHLFQF